MKVILLLDLEIESTRLKNKLSRQFIGNRNRQQLGQVKEEISNLKKHKKLLDEAPLFYSPFDIVISQRLNCIVVSDYGNQRLQLFSLSTKKFGKSIPVGFMPAGLCIEEGGCPRWPYSYDENDHGELHGREDALIFTGGHCHLMKVNLTVLVRSNQIKLGVFDKDYTWCVGILDESGRTAFKEPSSVSVSYGNSFRDNLVFVADMYNNAVQIVSTVDGRILQTITQYVSYSLGEKILLERPNVVNAEYYAKFREVILTSPDKKNIHIIRHVSNNEWILVKSIGNDSLYNPYGICVDETSSFNYKIIISDSYHSNLKIIDRLEGTIEQTFGSKGKAIGNFFHPYGLCLNKKAQEVLVIDRNNSRIQVIDYS